jgi:hypothetical protein
MKIFKRAGYIVKEVIVFIIIIVMALIIAHQKPTIVNFIFMLINFFFLGVILAGSQKTYMQCVKMCKILKIYSALILLLSVAFSLVVSSKVLKNTDFDDALWKDYPIIANNTDIIGFSNYGKADQS